MTEITSITEVTATTVEEAKKTVTFRGQEVTLKYPLHALMKLEDAGVSLSDINTDAVKVSDLVKLIWAGLVCQFPDATVEEIANSYEMSDMEQLGQAMTAAFKKATGK